MDETKLDNKLASFYAKMKKLVTDFMQYIETHITAITKKLKECEELCVRAESSTVELGDINKALEEIIEIQNNILNGGAAE